MARPICVHCGALYGSRTIKTEIITCSKDEEKPLYRGNHVVVRERSWFSGSSAGSIEGVKYGPGQHVICRRIWDGQSYETPYEPFCTVRCGFNYGRKSYAESRRRRESRDTVRNP